ncbi:MAG: pyrroline-5-carboxylate reductase [Clostridiales bacterium]|nr:pyrroline-5-carboxylate reductase [Clostridiales bacterium]
MSYLAGFIGAGNMGGALARAAAKSAKGSIVVSDRDKKKAAQLAEEIGAKTADNSEIAKKAKYIFLGVKPQMLTELFEEIAPILQERKDEFILVTMAAGRAVETVEKLAGCDCPVIRIMPNTPAAVGKGMILYCTNGKVASVGEFLEFMEGAGMLDEIPEKLIDAASAITGCAPAWIDMFMEAMADGGVLCGLPRDKALKYAAAVLSGTAELALESGKHPGELKDAVCSPGGTTIEGLAVLEKHAFRSAVIEAVTAAYEKNFKL